jgi:uncharacterized protein
MFADSPLISWRMAKQRLFLEGVKCITCSAVYYPQKYTCVCGSHVFETIHFSGKGKLLSFTHITVAPAAFTAMVPYHLGLIEFEEGARLVAQVTDVAFEELSIGIPVIAVFRRLYTSGEKGIIHYGLKFRPEF